MASKKIIVDGETHTYDPDPPGCLDKIVGVLVLVVILAILFGSCGWTDINNQPEAKNNLVHFFEEQITSLVLKLNIYVHTTYMSPCPWNLCAMPKTKRPRPGGLFVVYL